MRVCSINVTFVVSARYSLTNVGIYSNLNTGMYMIRIPCLNLYLFYINRDPILYSVGISLLFSCTALLKEININVPNETLLFVMYISQVCLLSILL